MKILFVMSALIVMLAACSGQGHNTQSSTSGGDSKKSAQDKGHSKIQKKEPSQKGKDKKTDDTKKQTKKHSQNHQNNQEKKPKYKLNKKTQNIEPIGDADPKVVLLRIDDAPDKHAVGMAKTLKKMHAKAIFFIIGDLIKSDKGKEKLKKIHNMGFRIGNHTMTHPFLSKVSKPQQRKEMVPVYHKLKKITGKPVEFFGAPHGDNTAISKKLAAKQGALWMNWTYGYDWKKKYQDPKALEDIMVKPDPSGLLHNGSILLMHDHPWDAKALSHIVKGLRDKGYHFVDPAEIKTPETSKAS